ncbi:MAG TPA: bifunctional acetate--CoA ligase family protein/GNAT family N-acetyltransferase [Gammaproteobacteria bacterium]|nr:bifunctional acetate--CoA ligase family protein/GNAT family N-acetyltransferase [Gammaproteobacteria bacterium]
MTIRNLDAVFRPRSVALLGASERPGSIGRFLLENLRKAGFRGDVFAVNPNHSSVLGQRAYASVAALPQAPDLAVIATPAATVPKLVADVAAAGTRAAIVISAGFGANGVSRQALLDAGRERLLRIVGPNTLGVIVPAIGLNASFAHLLPAAGGIAFLTQSGAISTSVLDWAAARGIGFSHVVALGDMADVDFGDMLDYLANDAATHAILMYMEAVTQPRKFLSAARAAARTKPVIVVKGGRHAASAAAAASHTGRLAGNDAEYSAAFRRAGMLRVASLDELFDAVETLAVARAPRGARLGIVTNGGGLGVLAADALLDAGGELATLSATTLGKLSAMLPPGWSHGNPVDVIGDATPERFAAALDLVLDDEACDAVLVLHCPTAVSSGFEAARAVAAVCERRADAAVFTSWLGEETARAARAELAARRVPTYATPEHAVRAFMQRVDYRRNQELLIETPPAQPEFAVDGDAVRAVFAAADADGREWLAAPEVRTALSAYGVPTTGAVLAATPAEAAAAAERFGGSIALKIQSRDIVHKSDVGGVALNLRGREATARAAQHMLERVRAAAPGATLEGFSVEPMQDTAASLELIVGVHTGGDFGPVLLFGEGGTAVEVVADTALELLPLNLALAHALMRRTRVYRRMRGFRHVSAVDLDAVALALTRVAQLAIDQPRIAEIEINPLLASGAGCVALDARLRLRAPSTPRAPLSICPYPRSLEQGVTLADGRTFTLRPIRPEDEPALLRAFERLTEDEIRARFFVPMKTLPHVTAARFTQIDYDREMAFVLAEHGAPGVADIHGVVRLVADPDNRSAEFAIIVERALSGLGLGGLLMRRLIDYARSRGIGGLTGDVLPDNAVMLALAASLGFKETRTTENVVRVSLSLEP